MELMTKHQAEEHKNKSSQQRLRLQEDEIKVLKNTVCRVTLFCGMRGVVVVFWGGLLGVFVGIFWGVFRGVFGGFEDVCEGFEGVCGCFGERFMIAVCIFLDCCRCVFSFYLRDG